MSEDQKKKIEPIFTSVVYDMEILKNFASWCIETFEPKIYKDIELYQVFMYNFYAKLI